MKIYKLITSDSAKCLGSGRKANHVSLEEKENLQWYQHRGHLERIDMNKAENPNYQLMHLIILSYVCWWRVLVLSVMVIYSYSFRTRANYTRASWSITIGQRIEELQGHASIHPRSRHYSTGNKGKQIIISAEGLPNASLFLKVSLM